MERGKEYIERRVIEPVKFLFLPEMGFLGSKANTKKNNHKLWAPFELCFFIFSWTIFFYIVASALKSCLISSILWGVEIVCF